jgi:hypothetical protein
LLNEYIEDCEEYLEHDDIFAERVCVREFHLDHKEHGDEETVDKEVSALPFNSLTYLLILLLQLNICCIIWLLIRVVE